MAISAGSTSKRKPRAPPQWRVILTRVREYRLTEVEPEERPLEAIPTLSRELAGTWMFVTLVVGLIFLSETITNMESYQRSIEIAERAGALDSVTLAVSWVALLAAVIGIVGFSVNGVDSTRNVIGLLRLNAFRNYLVGCIIVLTCFQVAISFELSGFYVIAKFIFCVMTIAQFIEQIRLLICFPQSGHDVEEAVFMTINK